MEMEFFIDSASITPADSSPSASEQQFLNDVKNIVSNGQKAAAEAINRTAVFTYWNIGKRIVEQEQQGNDRAGYGSYLLDILSEELTSLYGQGYTPRNLRNFRQFYRYFPDSEIWHACVPNLSWTHFRALLRVDDEDARIRYSKEAV